MAETTLSSIEEALARLASSSKITRGTPASAQDVTRLEAELGARFPDDFKAFLGTFGALRVETPTGDIYGDIVVLGHGEGELDIRTSKEILDAHYEDWGRERADAVAFLRIGSDPGDFHVFDPQGRAASLYRATFEAGDRSFAAIVKENLGELERSLAESSARTALESGTLEALERWLAPGTYKKDGGVIHARSARGHEVEIRLGDGREFHVGLANLPGIFYKWNEALGTAKLGDVVQANRRLLCARGSAFEDRIRFRGRLLAVDIPAELAAFVLEHDAGVQLSTPAALPAIDPQRVAAIFESTRYSSSFEKMTRKGETEWSGTLKAHGEKTPVTVSLSAARDVLTISTTLEVGTQDEGVLLELLNGHNRGLPLISHPDHDGNFDMEHMPTFDHPRADAVEVWIRCFDNALDDKRIGPFANDVVDGVRELKRRLDIRDPLDVPVMEAALGGLHLGPLARAMAERQLATKRAYKATWSEMISSVPWIEPLSWDMGKSYTSPWGRLVPFAQIVDADLVPRWYTAALVVRGDEPDSDACPVVCIDSQVEDDSDDFEAPRDAVIVARSVRDFLSLVALGSSGVLINDEESAAFAKMRFYDFCARYEPNREFLAWLEALGIEPAQDPLAIVRAAGSPQRGKAEMPRG